MAVRHTHQADHRDPHTPDAQTSILGHLSELGLRQDQDSHHPELPQMLDFQGHNSITKSLAPERVPAVTLGMPPPHFQLRIPLSLPIPERSHFIASKSLLCSACHLSLNLGCSSSWHASPQPAWLSPLSTSELYPFVTS